MSWPNGTPAHAKSEVERRAFEHAVNICQSINAYCFIGMGMPELAKAPVDLSKLSLREMLDAYELVERHNHASWRARDGKSHTSYLVPDPRLIAAVYVLFNYTPSRLDKIEPIVARPRAFREYAFVSVALGPAEKFEESDEEEEAA